MSASLSTPSETSPWNFFQERYRTDGWRLLCCTIMLNLTTGTALEGVHEMFFRYFPTPQRAAEGDEELMRLVLQPLGMQNVRARRIRGMSRDYLSWDGKDPAQLHGIGKYGSDSYRIFISGVLLEDVEDKELRRYVDWAKTRVPAPEPSEDDRRPVGDLR